jgi:hypothetical protein
MVRLLVKKLKSNFTKTNSLWLHKEFCVLLLLPFVGIAQWNPTNPLLTSPEDCPVAMRLCDATREYNFQLAGDGLIDDAQGNLDLVWLSQTSPTQFESKICFVKFTPQYSGDLQLVICPETSERLQWQLWKNYDCSLLPVFNNPSLTPSYKDNLGVWASDMGCTGIGYPNNPYNPTLQSPSFLPYSEPLIAGVNYLLVIHTKVYNQTGTHRFTLKFTGPVVQDHPDVFNHPECSMATEELVKIEDYIEVYPNPFTNKLTIQSPLHFDTINLYDVTGKLILTQEYQTTIEVKGISQGVYFLHLIDNEGAKVVKKVVRE